MMLNETIRLRDLLFQRSQDELGLTLTMTSGDRSTAQQKILYDAYIKNLDLYDRGVITAKPYPAAHPGSSAHEQGRAFDIAIHAFSTTELDSIVSIAKEIGLEWGGDFSTYDPVHFQLPRTFVEKVKDTVEPALVALDEHPEIKSIVTVILAVLGFFFCSG